MLKHETWYVQSGKFIYRWIDTNNANLHEKTSIKFSCIL